MDISTRHPPGRHPGAAGGEGASGRPLFEIPLIDLGFQLFPGLEGNLVQIPLSPRSIDEVLPEVRPHKVIGHYLSIVAEL